MKNKTLAAQFILEDGTRFKGRAFGYLKEAMGEAVFFSGTAGYQETMTDPALCGKIVVMTYPLVGNYGINLDDNESRSPYIRGLVVRDACEAPNNWRCEMELASFLKQNKIMGIEGVDTRAVTRYIQEKGAMKAFITTRGAEITPSQLKQKFDSFKERGLTEEVTCKEKYVIEGMGAHLGIIDLGIKNSVIRELSKRGLRLTVFPAGAGYDEIRGAELSGLLLSGGPGNPMEMGELASLIKRLLGEMPLIGIGLGHEVIAIALGCQVEKLKYGHHGASYPVKEIKTGKLYTTSQNHDYYVAEVPPGVDMIFRSINDGVCEGIACRDKMVYSVDFNPETQAFGRNTGFVFDNIKNMLEIEREARKNA